MHLVDSSVQKGNQDTASSCDLGLELQQQLALFVSLCLYLCVLDTHALTRDSHVRQQQHVVTLGCVCVGFPLPLAEI